MNPCSAPVENLPSPVELVQTQKISSFSPPAINTPKIHLPEPSILVNTGQISLALIQLAEGQNLLEESNLPSAR